MRGHGSHRMCKKKETHALIITHTHKTTNKRRTRGKKLKKKRWNPSEWRSILASTFTFELFGLHHQLKCRPWLFFFSRKLVLLELWRKGNRTGRRWKVADAWHWVTKWEKRKKKTGSVQMKVLIGVQVDVEFGIRYYIPINMAGILIKL